jgi:hypothetical protein
VVARLVRIQRRVEVFTSAAVMLGVGGDARHDVLDRLATVSPDATDHLALVIENLAVHRRADLVIAVLGRVGPPVVRALGLLDGISAVAVLTQPVTIAPSRSLAVVDAANAPFAAAWNRAFTDRARRTGRDRVHDARWQAARA